jgi:phage terminase large subunit-like protein
MTVTDALRTDGMWMLNPATMGEALNPDLRVNHPHIDLIARENIRSVLDPDVFVHVTQTQNQIGKSSTVAESCVTWLLEMFPTLPIMIGSHSKELSRKSGRAIRNNFANNSDRLSTRLAPDSKAADRWNTTAGGSLFATSVGGGVGWPATVFVGDDLLKNFIMAQSADNRQKAIDWLMGDVIGKLRKHIVRIPDAEAPGGFRRFTIHPTILLPATRYHLDDPSGRMMEVFPDRFRLTHLPGIADSRITPEGDALGREDGEVVCEDFYSATEMENLRDIMDDVTFATMVQGTPMNLTGGTIDRDRWVWATEAPALDERRLITFTSWDLTFTDTGKSWVVGQCWTALQSPMHPTLFDLYLVDQIRRKADFVSQRLMVRAFCAEHPEATHHLVENKANGSALMADLALPWIDTTFDASPGELRRSKGATVGFDGTKKWPAIQGLIPIEPLGSKLARTIDVSRLVHDGRVFLPEWWQPKAGPRYPGDLGDDPLQQFPFSLINEAADIPYGATDDECDTATQAISWARDYLGPLLAEGIWGASDVPRIARNTSRMGRR